jgi:hypothetical protein
MKNLIALSLILALCACNTYDDTAAFKHLEVPPYTETGANTFGCLINGAVWANFGEDNVKSLEPLGGRHLVPNKVGSHVFWDGSRMDSLFSLSAGFTLSKHGTVLRQEDMVMYIPKNGNLKGMHQLTSYDYQLRYTNWITGTEHLSLISTPFTVIIKKDTIEGNRHIVSGTFSGTIYNGAHTDSLRIVGGVFDTTLQ